MVNYDSFRADDIICLNSLIDKNRAIDGIAVQEEVSIIGLINTNKPDCYQGSDFYSRFQVRDLCPIHASFLQEAIPKLPLIEKSETSIKKTTINLFQARNWKDRLLGQYLIKDKHFVFQPGALAGVNPSASVSLSETRAETNTTILEIQNAPWEDKEFQRFWQEAILHGEIHHAGEVISIPPNLKLIQTEGYDFTSLQKWLVINEEDNRPSLALNPSCLHQFYGKYQCNADSTISKQAGLIEKNAGQPLEVYLSRSLTEDEWAMLLHECQRFQVTLQLKSAAGVKIPEALNLIMPESTPNFKAFSHEITAHTTLIQSSDIDTTEAILTAEADGWIIFDIAECQASDLLLRLDGQFIEEDGSFQFNQTEMALLKNLKAGKKIILKGKFSDELADNLAGLLLKRQNKTKGSGQLVILTEESSSFQYLEPQIHQPTAREKIACLGKITAIVEEKITPFLDYEPLSQLRARCHFWQQHPETNSSEEAFAGLSNLPLNKPTSGKFFPDISGSDKYSSAFTQQRKDAVNASLENAPHVFIAGLSGVGKSTFILNDFKNPDDTLHSSFKEVKEWAKMSDSNRKLLFIDEATLSESDWTLFEGLYHKSPGILIDGEYYPLTAQHKVIFAGNPVSYGDERKLATFFARHGNTLIFDPLPPVVIYEKILKPVFADTALEKEAETQCQHFLAVYHFLLSCSTSDVLITPRELQMMAVMTVMQTLKKNNPYPVDDISKHYAYELAKNLVPKNKKAAFENLFRPKTPLSFHDKALESEAFLLTPSRYPIYEEINSLLSLREFRQNNQLNDDQLYGGLGGIILDGEPGIGKTELVIEILRSWQPDAFEEIKDITTQAKSPNCFYRMPVSLSQTEKEKLLLKAFDEGAIVLVDEINAAPMMESLLNNLLMGRSPDGLKRPKKPGFLIIGTQNPITMAGRVVPSTALSRRMISRELALYPDEDMQTILTRKGLNTDLAATMIQAFIKNRNFARNNHLSPVPTFRDLLKEGEAILLCNQPKETFQPVEKIEELESFTELVLEEMDSEQEQNTSDSEGSLEDNDLSMEESDSEEETDTTILKTNNVFQKNLLDDMLLQYFRFFDIIPVAAVCIPLFGWAYIVTRALNQGERLTTEKYSFFCSDIPDSKDAEEILPLWYNFPKSR